jgi:hypothetical protein
MAYADLLEALAEHPQGVYVEAFEDADVAEALEAGLVRIGHSAAADILVLTARGRRLCGIGRPAMPPRMAKRPQGALAFLIQEALRHPLALVVFGLAIGGLIAAVALG